MIFPLCLSGEPRNSVSNVLDTEHNFQIKCFWLICIMLTNQKNKNVKRFLVSTK